MTSLVIDYGVGNSCQRPGLEHRHELLSLTIRRSSRAAPRVILPGVGRLPEEWASCSEPVSTSLSNRWPPEASPVLGICLVCRC